MAETAAQKAAAAALQAIQSTLNNLGTGTSTGNVNIVLPNKDELTKFFKKGGLSSSQINTIVEQYAGKPLIDTVTGSTPTSGSGLIEAIAKLPTPLQSYVIEATGLNDESLGTSIISRAGKILPFLQGAGSVTSFDLPLVLQYESNVTALSKANNALASGDASINRSASETAIYGAEAAADNVLTQWGIDTPEMTALVSSYARQGMTNQNEILDNIRQTQTYKQTFAGLAEYNANPGHVKMTESEYRSFSQSVQGAAQQYGNMTLTQDEIGKILKSNITAPEWNQRMSDIGSAVQNADANVKNILKTQYGVTESDLFHYLTRGSLPKLQREVASADIQDYNKRIGLGGVDKAGVDQLAQMAKISSTQSNQGLGYGVSQIEQGLLGASRDVALTKSLPGAANPTVNTKTLIASQLAGFGGISQIAAQTQVARAEEAKVAPFEKGGGYAESAKGVVGLGSART